jgi:hypothetical protein
MLASNTFEEKSEVIMAIEAAVLRFGSTFIRTAVLKPTSSELGGTTAIDGELDASDEAGFVTRKE